MVLPSSGNAAKTAVLATKGSRNGRSTSQNGQSGVVEGIQGLPSCRNAATTAISATRDNQNGCSLTRIGQPLLPICSFASVLASLGATLAATRAVDRFGQSFGCLGVWLLWLSRPFRPFRPFWRTVSRTLVQRRQHDSSRKDSGGRDQALGTHVHPSYSPTAALTSVVRPRPPCLTSGILHLQPRNTRTALDTQDRGWRPPPAGPLT